MIRELWFKTIDGETKPFKLVDKYFTRYNSREKLFKHLKKGETVKYFRIEENKTIVRKSLYIKDIFINSDDIMTLEGDFQDLKENECLKILDQ